MESGKSQYEFSKYWQLILFFASLKLLVHLLTYSNFELHRDAYLYYAQSEHLSWGYISVPPGTAFICKLATLIFGNSVFGLRFFPALIGAASVLVIGLAVLELGGRGGAISLASLGFLLSPSFLHVNALMQPVCFDLFYWLLSGYFILVLIKRQNPKMWIWIGLVFGLAFLNKYSIVFFYVGFAISLLISRHRLLYWSKYFIMGLFLGLIIILPNVLWQFQHNWPVLHHMSELRETQLVHVLLLDFIIDQFLMNLQAVFLWLLAILLLLFYKPEIKFRIFGFIYILVIALLMLGSGKSYYSLGLYPILLVFGAYFIEKYSQKYFSFVFGVLIVFMGFTLYASLYFDGVPLITFEKAMRKGGFRWEDGVYHDLPQDMADMTGWKEIGQKVSAVYSGLGEENRNNCDIYCYHYGQAGAVMFYGKKINIPQPISFNGSFVFWSPDSLTKKYMIWVHSDMSTDMNPDSLLPQLFQKAELVSTIDNNNFRENGTRIYLCEYPTEGYKASYKRRISDAKRQYNR